jgi:hypothetical protein
MPDRAKMVLGRNQEQSLEPDFCVSNPFIAWFLHDLTGYSCFMLGLRYRHPYHEYLGSRVITLSRQAEGGERDRAGARGRARG